MPPIKWPPVQVHHGFHIKSVLLRFVDYGVRKPVEIQLPVFALNKTRASWILNDATQSQFKIVDEIIPKSRLTLFIPKRRRFQFFVGFRMADDAKH